jgi:peptidoglycan hydrolase CwlO-like protein
MKRLVPAKLKRIFIAVIIILLVSFTSVPAVPSTSSLYFGPTKVEASLESDLKNVQDQLTNLKNQKKTLQNQINSEKNKQGQYSGQISTLTAQAELLDVEISEKQLKIDELSLSISILKQSIEETESDIIDSKSSIKELEEKTDVNLAQMYVEQKVVSNDISMVFSSGSTDNFLKNAQYKNAVQEDTNKTLSTLEQKKKDLETKKAELEKDSVQLEKDKALLDEQKNALLVDMTTYNEQKSYYNKLISDSKKAVDTNQKVLGGLTAEEQELLAKEELLQQQIFNSIKSIPNGARVLKGTIIGYEGCTGICTGPHLHFAVQYDGGWRNPCSALPYKTLVNATCGVSSNPLITRWPLNSNPYLTSGYRTSSRPTHNAIDLATHAGDPIYATHDGWYIRGNDGACSGYYGSYPCNGSGANYVKICSDKNNCSNGLSTMYFHLQ